MERQQFIDKTYAGWLGKNIGIRVGSPVEWWDFKDIMHTYGYIDKYVIDYKIFAADDDANGPLFFAKTLLDSADNHDENAFAKSWLNYVPYGHGFIWWGGNGISTEHTAYDHIFEMGHKEFKKDPNSMAPLLAQQIGGQIFSDSWGFIFPDDCAKAAEYARRAAKISHEGEAVIGGMFVGACVSAAYTSKNIFEVMERALEVIPSDSEYYKCAKDMIRFYNEDETKNWKTGLDYVFEKYNFEIWGGGHIIPNAALVILSLAYGNGNFTDTMAISTTVGWDTDCNAGNVGSIVGVLVGYQGIEEKWIDPVNDRLLFSSVVGSENVSTISEGVDLFVKLNAMNGGYELPEYLKEEGINFHFQYEGSRYGVRTECSDNPKEFAVKNEVINGTRMMKAIYRTIEEGKTASLFFDTYMTPEDLHDTRYDPGFSPRVYNGQTFEITLYNGADFNTVIAPVVEFTDGTIEQGEQVVVKPTSTVELTHTIKEGYSKVVKAFGFKIIATEQLNRNFVAVAKVKVAGTPSYEIAKFKVKNFGHSEHLHTDHLEIDQFTYSNGEWDVKENGITVTKGQIFTYSTEESANKIDLKFTDTKEVKMLFNAKGAYYADYLTVKEGKIVLETTLGGYKVLFEGDVNPSTIESISIDQTNDKLNITINDEKFSIDYAHKVKGMFGLEVLNSPITLTRVGVN